MATTDIRETSKLGIFGTIVLFLAVSIVLPVLAVGVLSCAAIVALYMTIFERERKHS